MIVKLVAGSIVLAMFYANAHADRLIRRSDAKIISIGLGNLDEKKQTVLFRSCADKEGKIFNLKEYAYQTGKDCDGPGIFTILYSLGIEGAAKASTGEDCSTGQNCLRYVVKSPEDAEKVFDRPQKGDVIDVFIGKSSSEKGKARTREIDLILKLKRHNGAVADTMTFKNIAASDSFVATIAPEKQAEK
jgi:hypothetical protein